MPVSTDLCDTSQRQWSPNFRYIRLHLPLASYEQAQQHTTNPFFLSATSIDGPIHKQVPVDIHLPLAEIRVKRQLKETLIRHNIGFDDYRRGQVDPVDICHLVDRFDIPPQKDIFIHPCDFMDYKLETMTRLSPFLSDYTVEYENFGNYTAVYENYDADKKLDIFKHNVAHFKSNLSRAMKQHQYIDCRMTYDMLNIKQYSNTQ